MTSGHKKSVPDGLDLDGEQWRYALRLYSQPGVPEASIFLQDTCGVDVNILFIAIFAAVHQGRALDATAIAAADAHVESWRTGVVKPLRAIRREMKTAPDLCRVPASQELRSSVKAAELRAEQIELALLAAWLKQARLPSASSEPRQVIETVVAHFARAHDPARDLPKEGPHREHMERLAAAARAANI